MWIWGLVSAVWPGYCSKGMGAVLFFGWGTPEPGLPQAEAVLTGLVLPVVFELGECRSCSCWDVYSIPGAGDGRRGYWGAFLVAELDVKNGPCNQLAQAWARPLQQWFFPASTSAFLFIANTLGEVLWNRGSFCLITWESLPKLFQLDLYIWPCGGTQ